MDQQVTLPRPEDLVSVGSRISWGAIFAGAVLALGLYSLFSILGGAVGLSLSERVNPSTLKTTAIGWALLTMLVAVFVGGVVTSQFTVGESKTEAMLYGAIMWALLFGFLAAIGAAGVRTGFHALAGYANYADTASTQSWDRLARDAGVPADQIDTWRQKLPSAPTKMNQEAQDPVNQEAAREAATRLTWYAFIGTWLSMISAAVGAMVGAGPRFKVVVVRTSNRVLS
jgi:hypothetical protein